MLTLGSARTPGSSSALQPGQPPPTSWNPPPITFWDLSADPMRGLPRVCTALPGPAPAPAHLEDVIGTLAAQVVLAGQDHHRFGEHLQADGADELLLQAVHAVCIPEQRLETHCEVHPLSNPAYPGLDPGPGLPSLPLDPSSFTLDSLRILVLPSVAHSRNSSAISSVPSSNNLPCLR